MKISRRTFTQVMELPLGPMDYQKTRKVGIPMRLIINTIGSCSYELAKFVARSLNPLVGYIDSYIKGF